MPRVRGAVQRTDPLVQLYEHLLRQILGRGSISQHAQTQAVDHALVFANQPGKCRRVARAHRRPGGNAGFWAVRIQSAAVFASTTATTCLGMPICPPMPARSFRSTVPTRLTIVNSRGSAAMIASPVGRSPSSDTYTSTYLRSAALWVCTSRLHAGS